MTAYPYVLGDGETLCVGVGPTAWSVWLEGHPSSLSIGWPLGDLVAEVLGIDIVHDDSLRRSTISRGGFSTTSRAIGGLRRHESESEPPSKRFNLTLTGLSRTGSRRRAG